MNKLLCVLLVLCSFNVYASQEQGTVGFLLKACTKEKSLNQDDAYDIGYCGGTITSHFRYLFLLERVYDTFDLPDELTIRQLEAVFIKWAKEHPEKWHESDYVGMSRAVMKSFPKQEPNSSN